MRSVFIIGVTAVVLLACSGAMNASKGAKPSSNAQRDGSVDDASTKTDATATRHDAGSSKSTRTQDAGATADSGTGPAAEDSGGASGIGQYDVFELSLKYPTASLSNPWEQVTVTADVTTPSGKKLSFEGFYYDVDTYELRFTPIELGDYHYTVTISGPTPAPAQSGTFSCVSSKHQGFLRPHPKNPYRLIFEKTGVIANAIGINDCWSKPSAGALSGFIEAGKSVSLDEYMASYGDAGGGFNVLRWNPANCSFDIVQTIAAAGNTYLVPEGKRGDELLATAHAHGFHVMFAFFHLQEWNATLTNASLDAAVKKAVRYAMARYGAYVDVWELTNESDTTTIPNAWLQSFADFVRARDPYQRVVTNSWERASDWGYLDARSPHLNIYNDALVDEQKLTNSFSTGIPVIAGEMYNVGSVNWDASSAHHLRTYAWTAFMSGLVDVYWNTTYHKSTGSSPTPNLYIGAQERGYIAQLQRVSAGIDPDVVSSTVGSSVSAVTAHALRSAKMLLVYAYRGSGSGSVALTVDVPVTGTASWIDPQTGTTLQTAKVTSGMQALMSPAFAEDVALLVK